MRTIIFLVQKEFKQIFRSKALLSMIILMPIIQLLILPLAADYEVKNINFSVVDNDHSVYSQKLVSKITCSNYFKLAGYNSSFKEAFKLIEKDKADLIIEIPKDFERNLLRNGSNKLFIAINAINGVKAGIGGTYITKIINDFNKEINLRWMSPTDQSQNILIETVSSNWYNPFMNYDFYMVPGLLAALVTIMCSYMTFLIVKEKETGTIEQINVTPIKKIHFIIGKLIPFWVLGMFVFTLGLFTIAYFVYGIISQGSIFLLYAFLSLYLTAMLGLGLLISTYSETQQQAMSIAFFFLMISILMSGLFTSIESMPVWAKSISYSSPLTYFTDVMRLIVLKGSSFADLKWHFLILIFFTILFNGWAVINYKKTK